MIRQLANRDLLLHVLDVMDDFGRALAAVPEEQRESGWVSGTAMIEKKLYGVLERAGVRPIEALGQPFDPALHEAVASDPGSDGSTVRRTAPGCCFTRELRVVPGPTSMKTVSGLSRSVFIPSANRTVLRSCPAQ